MSPLFEAFGQPLLTAAVTLRAAFLGAWYAFRLNDNARARQTVRDQVAAVNKALFVLLRQFNTLAAIKRQIIDPAREHPARFIAMRSFLPVDKGTPAIDIDSLSFLLETEDRGLLVELLLEQERFTSALQALNERSRLHQEILQPSMAATGIQEGVEYTEETIKEAVGESFVLRMQRATDDAISHVDQTIDTNLEFAERFHSAMKSAFPKHSIIRFEPKQPYNSGGHEGD